MTWLLKLSRIAFICNLFFLLAFSLQLTKWVNDEQLTSTILIIGYVMGFILNPLANFSYLVFGIFSRRSLIIIPSWLIVANVLFLVIDAFYILYINAHSWYKIFWKINLRSSFWEWRLFFAAMLWSLSRSGQRYFPWKNCLGFILQALLFLGKAASLSASHVASFFGPWNL